MSDRILRVSRCVAVICLVVALGMLVMGWVWRGYEPPLQIVGQSIAPLAFSPQGDILVAGSTDIFGGSLGKSVSPIHFLSARDGSEVQPPLATHATARPTIVRAEYSPNSKMLAVLQSDGSEKLELIVFDLATRSRLAVKSVAYSAWSASPNDQAMFGFARDSSFFYLSGPVPRDGNLFSRSVVVWDLVAGKARFSLDKTGNPAVSPDSQTLVTIDDLPWNDYSKKAVLQVRNIETGEPIRSVELSDHQRGWPAFSPDGKFLVIGYNGLLTEVFDSSNYQRVSKKETYGPKFLADGTLISVVGRDVQVWNTDSWQIKQTYSFDLGRHWDNGDQLSPVPGVVPRQPKFVVFNYYPSTHPAWLRWLTRTCQINAYGSHQLTLIDTSDGSRLPIELHENQSTSGAIFSPSGDKIAIGYLSGNFEVWDLPPSRSYVAPCYAAGLALVLSGLIFVLRKRRDRDIPASTPDLTNGGALTKSQAT